MAEKLNRYFPNIPKIRYEGPDSKNPLAFKVYDENRMVAGRRMKDWLRFSVVYWHTFVGTGADPFGGTTLFRPWDNEKLNGMEGAKGRCEAAFECFYKLGVPYFTFHDRDVAPEGLTVAESNRNLDEMADIMEKFMAMTGVKLLWGTSNLFSAAKYMHGASTNPNFENFAHAAAQVKKCMEVTHRLGGENFVFWGGREGYNHLLNTSVKRELDHMAAFFKMVVAHKEKIGATFQLLIEPKPKEPTKHQYDYDAQTVMAFLRTYGLEDHFKLNIEPNHTTLAGHDNEHDVMICAEYGMLGSIDSNTGEPALGWDVDCFPMNFHETTMIMYYVLKQGGLGSGGLNFDCKVRRESTDLEDIFLGHIGSMDAFAVGLLNAAKMIEDGAIPKMVRERYSTWDTGLGRKVEQGMATLEEVAKFAERNPPVTRSGKKELYDILVNQYLLKPSKL